MYFQVQNSLNHAWTQAVNTRVDGSKILQLPKLEVLHAAVIEHCDALDGIKDGLLSDPRACKVDPQWVLCTAGAADTTKCLTNEEWTAASKLYMGATDADGRHFLPGGWQPGSELQWGGGHASAASSVRLSTAHHSAAASAPDWWTGRRWHGCLHGACRLPGGNSRRYKHPGVSLHNAAVPARN